jgi:hypothetical protein
MLHDWKLAFIPKQTHLQRWRLPLGAYRHAAAHLGCCTCLHHIHSIHSSLTSSVVISYRTKLHLRTPLCPPTSLRLIRSGLLQPLLLLVLFLFLAPKLLSLLLHLLLLLLPLLLLRTNCFFNLQSQTQSSLNSFYNNNRTNHFNNQFQLSKFFIIP